VAHEGRQQVNEELPQDMVASAAPSATPGSEPQAPPRFESSIPLVGAPEAERMEFGPPVPGGIAGPEPDLSQKLNTALFSVGDDDPDAAARASQMADEAGVQSWYAQLDPDEVKRRLAVIEAQRLDLARNAPKVAAAITADREFAVLTKDDLRTQQEIGWRLAYWAADNTGSMPSYINRLYLEVYAAWKAGRATTATGREAMFENLIMGSDTLSADVQETERQMTVLSDPFPDDDSLFMGSLKYLATQAGQRYENAILYMTLGGAGAAAGTPAGGVGAIPGAMAGVSAAAFADGFGTEAGLAYIEYRRGDYQREGMSHDTARKMALTHGLVAGLIEGVATRMLVSPIGNAFKTALRKNVQDALKQLTKEQIIRSGAVGVVTANVTEASEEALQRASALLLMELGRVIDDPEYQTRLTTPEGARELAKEISDEFMFSFRNGWMMAMIGPGSNTAARLSAYTRNADQLANFNSLVDQASGSKSAGRNKRAYAAFLQRVTGGSDAEFVYIDREELGRALEQANVSMQVAEQILPGLSDQFRDPAATGQPIRLRTSDYIASIGGTALDEAMRPHVRLSPGGLSMTQVAAQSALADKWVEDYNAIVENFEKIEGEHADTITAIEERLIAELAAAGTAMNKEEQEAAAHFYARSVLFMAQVEKMPVEEFERKYGLKIKQNLGLAAPDAIVNQAAEIDSTYMDAIRRNDMDAARDIALRAANLAGYTIEAYHGTFAEFDVFDPAYGYDEPGFHFGTRSAAEKRMRDKARERRLVIPENRLIRTRLRIQNPLRLAENRNLTWKVGDIIKAIFEPEEGNVNPRFESDIEAFESDSLVSTINGEQVAYSDIGEDLSRQTEWIRNYLRSKGFDGIVYENRVEGGESYIVFDPSQVKYADTIARDEWDKIVPPSRRFDLTSPRMYEQSMSTRVPTAKGMELAALEKMLVADLDTMLQSERMVDGNLRLIESLGIPVDIDKSMSKEDQLRQAIRWMADNLLALHDKMDAEQRARAKLWYVGGRRIVDAMAERYGITDMQAAAMLAVLSPQKNWFENVSMAFRIGDILTSQRDSTWTPEIDQRFRRDVADAKAAVPIAEARLAQAQSERPKRAVRRKDETDEKFAERMAAWERSKERRLAKYDTDLAQWQRDIDALDERIGEASEAGESTASLRFERAVLNREKPRKPRAPKRTVAETSEEFAARKAKQDKVIEEHAKRVEKLRKVIESKKKAAARMEAIDQSKDIADLRAGMTLGKLLDEGKFDVAARFVRYYDESYNSREFAIITPEGGMAGPSQGRDGPLTLRWGSFSTIAKAISVYEDGRVENIHNQIGMAHKVRNFYNNLFDPTNPDAGTIDTHAIAAAVLQALGASSDIVSWGLGSGVSDARLGLRGGYPIVFEAYRLAAQERGLLLREMQSITWEAVRGLFEAAMKKSLDAPVSAIWARYKAKEITIEQAREEIFTLAKGIKTPEWVTQPTDLPVSATYAGQSESSMAAMAPAQQKPLQESQVLVEVAPDPTDVETTNRWNALTNQQRHDISVSVMRDVFPMIMREFGISGTYTLQLGGFEGSTNYSFALNIPNGPLVRQISATIGYVLSQKETIALSHQQFQGSKRGGVVFVDIAPGLTQDKIHDLYVNVLKPIGVEGFTLRNGTEMVVTTDDTVAASALSNAIKALMASETRIAAVHFGESYVRTDKPNATYAGAGRGATGRRRLDNWRAAVTRRIADELDRLGTVRQSAVPAGGAGYQVESAADRGLAPLRGAPTEQGISGPDPAIVDVAREYARANGIPFGRQSEYATVNVERARRIADAYAQMKDDPDNPVVREAYLELARQTRAQYDALVAAGYTFYFFDPENDPYADRPGGFGNPWNAITDLRQNKRMAVYPTDAGYGTDKDASDYEASRNPLLADAGISWPYGSPDGPMRPVRINDLFRAVHDTFGHSLEGAGFRARGEENAWQAHVRLFYGPAVGAMTSETRGQNSWLNYGPHGATNRTASVESTVFADQKIGLMPEWTWTEGRVAEQPYQDGGTFRQSAITPQFYSALYTSMMDVDAQSMTAENWKQRVKGLIAKGIVKQDEYEWSGFEDFLSLDRPGKISKDEVLHFLANNGVKLTETVDTEPDINEQSALLLAVDRAEDMVYGRGAPSIVTPDIKQAFRSLRDLAQDALRPDELEAGIERLSGPINKALEEDGVTVLDLYEDNLSEGAEISASGEGAVTRFMQWKVKGGTEYREMRLSIPILRPQISRSSNLVSDGNEFYEYTIPGGFQPKPTAIKVAGGQFEVSFAQFNARVDTLEEADEWIRAKVNEHVGDISGIGFRTNHFPEANIVVHLRLTTRIDKDGKRTLFVEEIQSDWGQRGRSRGFFSTREMVKLQTEYVQYRDQRYEMEARSINAIFDRLRASKSDYVHALHAGAMSPSKFVEADFEYAGAKAIEENAMSEQDMSALREYRRIITLERNTLHDINAIRNGLPGGPFVKNTDAWTTLGLKQVLIEAVKGNYDRVAFANGDQTVGHYKDSITSAVDGVQIVREPSGLYSVVAYKGAYGEERESRTVFEELNTPASRVQELFGKAAAEQLIAAADATPGQTANIQSGNLSVGGDGLRKYYDTIVPKNLAKLLAKFGGPQIGVTNLRETTASVQQMSFDVTPALRERLGAGVPLFQSQPEREPPRGAYDPRRMMMMLNSRSDVSTFLHEMAHHHLAILSAIASDPNASAESKQNMDTILRWFGIAGRTPQERLANWNAMSLEQQRPYHEQLALNFEIYMFTGRSPSIEMESAFAMFARRLKQIYTDIKTRLNEIYKAEFGRDLPILTGEVREVFDRWFASEDQIARAEAARSMVPLFLTQEESGMSDADWADYQAAASKATRDSVSQLATDSLRVMQWMGNARSRILSKMQGEHRRLRASVRDEVAEEVRKRTVFRAMRYLRTGVSERDDGTEIRATGPHRLDMDMLETMYPATMQDRPDIRRLGTGGRGMMGREGVHPDVVAEAFGYASGDQLVRALIEAGPMDAAIDRETDERMVREYGDLNTEKAREEAVERALHNEVRARMIAAESKFVSRATQPVRVMLEAARTAARQILGARRVRDIRPGEYAAQESRAARDSEMAHSKRRTPEQVGKAVYNRTYGDLLSAVAAGAMTEATAIEQAKRAEAQAIETAKARQAEYDARYGKDSPEEVLVRAKRAQLLNNQLAKEAGDAVDEVRKSVRYLRNVLSDDNRRRMGADAAEQIEKILERYELRALSLKRIDDRKALAQWALDQQEMGITPDIPEAILAEAQRISYRDMTLDEFRQMVEVVEQIEHIGKNKNKALMAAKAQAFNEARDEIVQTIDREGMARGRDLNPETSRTKAGRVLQSVSRFMASHLKAAIIAEILDGGREGGPVWNYLIRSANAAGDRETRMRAEATEALAAIMKPLSTGEPTGGKGRWFPTIGMHLNRESRVTFAANWGNEGNRQRLMGGKNWTEEQVMPVLESLTSEEWAMVQQLWDYLETYKPMIADKQRRIYGKAPRWVEPTPFEIRTADGKTMQMRGGYYPIKYDPIASPQAERLNEIEKAKQQLMDAHISSTTRRSYTKERVDEVTGRPLLYSLSVAYNGINEVIHDLAWHEWLIDANRLINDKEFDRAVKQRLGDQYMSQLKTWVADVAAGDRGSDTELQSALAFVRQNISAAGLGYNIVSGAQQVVGFNQSIVKVGARHIGRAVMEFMRNPKRMIAEVTDKSMLMADRGRTQFRELNEIKNLIQQETTAMRRYKLGVFLIIVKMQRAVDVPTWAGAYEKALENGEDESTAVALADQAVIDSQGSGMLKDLSRVERGSQAEKLFTVFYSYMNTVHNMAALKGMTERNKAKLAADMVMLFFVPVALTRAIKSFLRPNEEDDELDFGQLALDLTAETLEYMMGTIVVVREIASAPRMLFGSEGARAYTGPAGLRMLTDVLEFTKQAGQLEFDRAFFRAGINLLGDTFGIPSAQINRTIDAIDAVVKGEVEGIDVPRAILFGTER
jgi:hypothetical protein